MGYDIVAKFDKTKRLITNRGNTLNANLMKTYCTKQVIGHIFTEPYHPLSKVPIKSLSENLVKSLKKLSSETNLELLNNITIALVTTRYTRTVVRATHHLYWFMALKPETLTKRWL